MNVVECDANVTVTVQCYPETIIIDDVVQEWPAHPQARGATPIRKAPSYAGNVEKYWFFPSVPRCNDLVLRTGIRFVETDVGFGGIMHSSC